MSQLNTSNTVWNFTPLFSDDNDPKIQLEREKLLSESYKFINKWKDRNDYLSDPSVLLEALNEYEEWARHYGVSGNEGFYFGLRQAQDQTNSELKAKNNKIEEIALKIQNDINFFLHRLAKVDKATQEKILAYQDLHPYYHFLEGLFAEAKYLLTEAEEKIINLMSPTSVSNWVQMTSEFISKETRQVLTEDGAKEEQTFSQLGKLLYSQKKPVRDSAAAAINDILLKQSDVAEHEMNSILAVKKMDDDLRNISRPDLTRHISDDIESEVVDVLLDAVSKRFEISQKFYELKSQLLGLPKLEYHERVIEYGAITKKYSYEDSINLVYKTFKNLDPEFADIVEQFVNNGQIDVYPRKGKSGGAFCAGDRLTNPVYILLNHQDTLMDVLTIAHEFGHAINDEFMKKKQNALNFGSPLSTAEVASTFMEDFVLQEILKESDDELKLAIMVMKLDEMIGSIQRQVAGYKFEQDLHTNFREKGYLSKHEIGEIFKKHMSVYMGPFVEQSVGSENWWIYWSHFRRFFYIYSYASGLLISMGLQNSVKANPEFISKVKEFLSTGSSDSPANIFLGLGINIKDPAFWNKGLDLQEQLLKETQLLAKKLGKIA